VKFAKIGTRHINLALVTNTDRTQDYGSHLAVYFADGGDPLRLRGDEIAAFEAAMARYMDGPTDTEQAYGHLHSAAERVYEAVDRRRTGTPEGMPEWLREPMDRLAAELWG
jgi:hypothetical protein